MDISVKPVVSGAKMPLKNLTDKNVRSPSVNLVYALMIEVGESFLDFSEMGQTN